MMKQLITLGFLFFGMLTYAQNKPAAKPAVKPTVPAVKTVPPILKTSLDSMSYAIGMLDGKFFKSQGISKVNTQLLSKGFSDALADKMLMSPEQANELVRREMQKASMVKIQPSIDEQNKFLAENRKKPGVKETASGLQYEVITMGTGAKPADTSTVKVHYEGFLLNGKKFDSSRDRGEPISFPLNQVIRGWTEGVQLMPIGSRFKFYIPYQLGYGEQGSRDVIPGGSLLIFDVELIDIVANQQ
ncbi:MAG: FKBP-type peptidyl-prolyl cis-trans isomerase [Sphingobacteriales bacterium]|jgi:FKBP-type peptidyl-prolyl cis-trans isomerase